MRPPRAARAPVRRLKNVVWPAPSGRRIAETPPASTARSRPARTTRLPKLRESPSTVSSGSLTARREPGQEGRVEQTLWPDEHHDEYQESVENLPPVLHPAQKLRKNREDRRAQDGAPEACEPAEDGVQHDEERSSDAERLGIDEQRVVRVEGAAEPGDHAARRKGRELHVGRVH